MIRRMINLFQQDLKVAARNKFPLVIIALAVLMVLIINFVIPEEVKITPKEIFLDLTQGQKIKPYLISEGMNESRFADNEEELYKIIKRDSNTLGVIAQGDLDNLKFTIIGQGVESEEAFNLLDAAMVSIIDHMRGTVDRTNHRVEYLRPQSKNIAFNKKMIPIIIFTEVVLLGFLLISVMVFQEKEEGSVRAYRVSPGGTLEYILAKVGVNLLLALIYLGIVIIFTMGFNVNFLDLLLVTVLANIFMTLLGLAISVYFKNLEEFIFVAVLIMGILALPLMSYLTPTFAPKLITILPSYPVLFGLREILFPTGKDAFISGLNWMLLIEGFVMLVISWFTVRRKLMKEGK